jgi:hypothetical protein
MTAEEFALALAVDQGLKRFHSYYALTRIARCGPGQPGTTKTSFASE